MRIISLVSLFIVPFILTGCSSSIARFDYPIFGYVPSDAQQTGAVKRPKQNRYAQRYNQGQVEDRNYAPVPTYDPGIARTVPVEPVEVRPYTPPIPPRTGHVVTEPRITPVQKTRRFTPKISRPDPVVRNGKVIVQEGDTLYSLAKRYGVSVYDLKAANNINGNSIKAGRQLSLPNANLTTGGIYRVEPGDTIRSISRKFGVPHTKIAALNNVDNPNQIKPGQHLAIPNSKTAVTAAHVERAVRKPESPIRQVRETKTKPTSTAANKLDRAPQTTFQQFKRSASKVVPLPPSKPAKPVKTARLKKGKVPTRSLSQPKFRWPVRGRIISRFGAKSDGTHNDGINVAVPLGASVRAAEDGTVAYVGNELRAYGNLILIRHSKDWVSAYAHNDKILVRRGQTVKRGDLIAKAGKTGSVSQPQVHFELRKGSKPVNPLKYMVGL